MSFTSMNRRLGSCLGHHPLRVLVSLGCWALAVGVGCGDGEGESAVVAQVGSSAITVQDFRTGVGKIRGEETSVADLDYPERLSVLDALLAARLLVEHLPDRSLGIAHSSLNSRPPSPAAGAHAYPRLRPATRGAPTRRSRARNAASPAAARWPARCRAPRA